jgi:hypothetical protein
VTDACPAAVPSQKDRQFPQSAFVAFLLRLESKICLIKTAVQIALKMRKTEVEVAQIICISQTEKW